MRLWNGQFGLGAGRSFARQGRPPALLPGILPPVSHLPGHAQTARHLGAGMSLSEQFACLKAAFFQLGMISCLQHANLVHRPPINVILLYDSQ
jgi:hypothetical protein